MKTYDTFFKSENHDVLLIQPPILKHTTYDLQDEVQSNYWKSLEKVGKLVGDLPIEPNWGLLYLASSLKANNISVQLIDFHLYDFIKFNKVKTFITEEEIEKILRRKKFKVVGISSITRSHYRALKIAEICKKIDPSCIVVLGGIHFSFIAEETITKYSFIDAIIRGEGENVLVEFVKNYNDRDKWKKLTGIIYRDDEGNIINNEGFNIISVFFFAACLA